MIISPNKWELDVQGYLNTCNITSATPRQQIRDFAKGVNDLGLWNSMVCWPLRSSQNYGTGTTAYSLGGLGTFNGTLANGPSWGTDGITNAATGRITTAYQSPAGSQAHIFVGNSGAGGGERAYGSTLTISGSDWLGFVFRDNGFFYGDGALISTSRDFTSAGSFKIAAALANRPADAYTYLNTTQGSITVGNAMLASNLSMTIMSAGTGQYFVGTAAFYATIVTALTPEQYISFYNLYKSTLGSGLSLP
jgi:hypothetical protein